MNNSDVIINKSLSYTKIYWSDFFGWGILALNLPVILFRMQYGIEDALAPNIIAAVLGLGLGLLNASLLELFLIKHPIELRLIIFFRILIGLILSVASSILLLNNNFLLLFWVAGIYLYLIWKEKEERPLTERIQLIMIIGVWLITMSGIWFQWLNFQWWTPSFQLVINGLLLALIFLTFYLDQIKTMKSDSTLLSKDPVELHDTKNTIESNQIKYIKFGGVFLYLALGLSVGLIMTLTTLISENLPWNNPTMIMNGVNLFNIIMFGLIFSLILEKAPASLKRKLSLLARPSLVILLGLSIIATIGIPWLLGTLSIIDDTGAGLWHLGGLFSLEWVILYLLTGTLWESSSNRLRIFHFVMFTFGILLGIAGYFFGGMNYRVGPEVGIIFTVLLLFGVVDSWRMAKKSVLILGGEDDI